MIGVKHAINIQREELKKAHNKKFKIGNYSYRIIYEGGLAEYVSVYGRKDGGLLYRFIAGFPAYDIHDHKVVIEEAQKIIQKHQERISNSY